MDLTTTTQLPLDAHITRDGRDVYFCSAVTHASAYALIKLLRAAEKDILDDNRLAKNELSVGKDNHKYTKIVCEPLPIMLYITTYGGGVHAGFAVVDTILSLKVPVHTVIVGHVASAGTLISIAGVKRFIQPHASALLHEVRAGTWGKISDVRDGFENAQKCMDRIVSFYAARTKLTAEQLTEQLRRDVEWDPQQCVDNGVVHEIVKVE